MRASSKFVDGLRSLARFSRRPARQRRLALEAAATLLLVKGMISAVPFRRWRWLLGAERRARRHPLSELEIAEIVWAVDQVSRRFPQTLTCLPRAVAVRQMLWLRGVVTELEIGVARDAAGKFEAHAWVEYQGRVIMGQVPDLERFAKLPDWPERARRGGWSRS